MDTYDEMDTSTLISMCSAMMREISFRAIGVVDSNARMDTIIRAEALTDKLMATLIVESPQMVVLMLSLHTLLLSIYGSAPKPKDRDTSTLTIKTDPRRMMEN